jgi:plastocyanin
VKLIKAARTFSTLVLLAGITLLPIGRHAVSAAALVGPKACYLALGDSLTYGYQPNFVWNLGYADAFFPDNLRIHVGDTVRWSSGFHTVAFAPASVIQRLRKLSGRVMKAVATMPGTAMSPARTTLTRSGRNNFGRITLSMFGRYAMRLTAHTTKGREEGLTAVSRTLPLPRFVLRQGGAGNQA